ncbi:apolipoprotein N-acyltransferase [Pseudoroseicyclus sp. CXY001]|uniref:apolipoprotein N-acyltransferase n=1 Tax=Pseudoroseicyclus sp. CXY001 TaxID=3242492 RepID=UPI00358DB043
MARPAALIALGALMALGQAPWGLWPLTLVALALAFWLGEAAPSGRRGLFRGRGFGWGLALGFGYFAVAMHWIVHPFLVEPEIYGWIAPFGLFFMALGGALFWAVGIWAARLAAPGAGRWTRLGALAGGLALAELARSFLFTGLPWALLGHIWAGTPLAQIAAVVGPHALTLLTLGLAALLAGLLPGRRPWLAALPALALGIAWPILDPRNPAPADGPLIRIVQPNAPQAEKWRQPEVFYRRLLALSAGGADSPSPALVVWPETAMPWWLEDSANLLPEMAEAARGAPLVTGILHADGRRFYNSLIALTPAGEVTSLYDKAHLVPFGEYMPFGELLGRFGLHGLAAGEGGGFSAGPGARAITLPAFGEVLPLICYEGIFAEEVRAGIRAAPERPRALLLVTNDAWFGPGAGPKQHLAQARLRAIETGLPMIRAANTGISAMIDARGRVTASLPLGVTGALDAALPEARPSTIYMALGDFPAGALTLLLLVIPALTSRRFRG